ncbi:hypothetical protein APR50_21515 [Variovorax paradoxus]|jgi:acyl homoserine lactone synthase|uniref:acyl-homoserine-lactone synthase n=1 Tax=Variovorax paradoxus TaxID=34073 RepID=UPI0006E6D81B|nr:hypothetical protein APR52_40465 [Variovorax paradoxus]KPV00368.1 hypothetical protein APR49_33930 [Variovorax paradoxus]KPV04650.1 hypothetical protein APR50_21515 [Variovorax paradoxus]KPV18186.1 hypothetical protein APR47_41815 [Variovorax paradoxus]KPV20350.1 hypothetical protein APR51_17370 [Variovorax paradoxus]
MHIVAGTANSLSNSAFAAMAHYRYRVFVEKLHWELENDGVTELDQFDRPDTMYVMARERDARLKGVARLLPTNQPYLLNDVFPELLDGHPPPNSEKVWELSRFSVIDLDAPRLESQASHDAPERALALLDVVMRMAAFGGADELVTVSPLGVERILRRAGVVSHRMGRPVCLNQHFLYACRIEIAPSIRRRAGH